MSDIIAAFTGISSAGAMSFTGLLQSLRTRMRSIEDRMPLRDHVALATGILCFVIVATLALGAALVGRNEAMTAATDDLRRIAVVFADRIDRGVASRVNLVEHLATLEQIRDIENRPLPDVRAFLAGVRDSFPDTAWIGFVSPDGVIRAAAGGAFEGQSVAHHDWFSRGLVAPTVLDSATEGARAARSGSPSFADTAIQRFVEIGAPVRSGSGAVVGVLGLYLGRHWADNLRRSTLVDPDEDHGIQVTLLHEDGRVVLDNVDEGGSLSRETLAAILGGGSGILGDDSGFLSAYAVSRDAGGGQPTWIVVARQRAAVAYQAADRVVAAIVALGIMVGIAGILGAVAIAARVAQPFQKLADKAALFGRGSTEMLPRVRGSFEAVRLSAVLRALVMRLGYAEKVTAAAEDRAAETARQLSEDIARLRNLADIDVLTDLLNRRAFMEFGKDAMDQYRRYGRPFAILMIDIDNFKRINDGLGHAAGDAVIRAVARTIARTLRPSDKGARFGGEEFIVLLRETSSEEAREVAERMRSRVAALPMMDRGNGELFVTVSVGVAVCGDGDADIQAVTERADIALYTAKGNGRNRIVIAAPPEREARRRIA